MKTTLVLVGLLTCATAYARDPSVRLAPTVDGWFLPLEAPTLRSGCLVELRDVSPLPGPRPKWVERVQANAATITMWLDPQRYQAAHTYVMSLRCGAHEVARRLVHLGDW